jgi:hypothetical protein
VVNKDGAAVATKFHCIECGKIWGDGLDIGSAGLCIECFSKWAQKKNPCFGKETLMEKEHCLLHKFCKEYYGIR